MTTENTTDEAVYEYGPFILHKSGRMTRNGKECDWYKDEKGRPWIPGKRKSFVSLVKQMEREGDFDSA